MEYDLGISMETFEKNFGEDKTKWGWILPIDYDNFFDYIENGIKDLVKILIDLGYTTLSSCEGHKDGDFHTYKKNVIIGVKSDEELNKLKSLFEEAEKELGLTALRIQEGRKIKVMGSGEEFSKTLHILMIKITKTSRGKEIKLDMEKQYKKLVSFLKSKIEK